MRFGMSQQSTGYITVLLLNIFGMDKIFTKGRIRLLIGEHT